MNLQGVVLVSVLLTAASHASEFDNDLMREATTLMEECGNKQFTMCLKEKAIRYINAMPSKLDLGSGVVITPNERMQRSARHFNPLTLPTESRAREEALDTILADKIVDYFNAHTFQFKFPENAIQMFRRAFEETEEEETAVEEGRKKKKKKGKGHGLMMLLQLKAALIGGILLKIIGFVAFKALMLAKIALVMVSIIGLKKVFEGKQHSSSYEIVAAHPYDDHHLDRSFDNTLPYRGYVENKNPSTNTVQK